MSATVTTAARELLSVAIKTVPGGKLGQYAVVTMRNEPVNALTMDMWASLLATLQRLEKDPKVRGMILTSGISKDIFTAGNDLLELYAPKTSAERYRRFWMAQTQFLAQLYRSRLVTIACVRGHSPAGGCGMALACDYRLMSSDTPTAQIGLNETAIGILVPKFWGQLLLKTVGSSGRAEKMLMFGQTASAQEALEIGLVHELVPKASIVEVAEQRMHKLLQVPDIGRQLTKGLLREEFSKAWEAYGEEEAKMGFAALSSPGMIKALGGALVKLGFDKSKL